MIPLRGETAVGFYYILGRNILDLVLWWMTSYSTVPGKSCNIYIL